MGIFDMVKGAAASAMSGNQQGDLASAAVQILGAKSGGLAGLVGSLAKGGLGSAVESWVSTGPNKPVSGEQLQSALGADQISQIAAKAGVPPELASKGLAIVLPMLIDKATPNGKVPAGAGLDAGLAGVLGSFLK